jgi:hypothetical protein
MKTGEAFRRAFTWVIFLASSLIAPRAAAHEPFDISSRMTAFGDRIEIVSTFGSDGVRAFLKAAGFTADEIAERLKARGPEGIVNYSPSIAAHLFELKKDSEPVSATAMTSRAEGMEIVVTITFARPAAGGLTICATAYETVPALQSGVLIAEDESAGSLGAAKLSRAKPCLSVPLPERHAISKSP